MTDDAAHEGEIGQMESPDDVRAWVVNDSDLKEDDDLDGGLFCPDCINAYVGEGEVTPVHHDNFGAEAFCDECGVFLGDE